MKNSIYSTNTSVGGSPFKITSDVAEEILEKAPESQEAQAVDPSGKIK